MLRAIREIKPKYIVGENVFGLLNWNGGMVFDEVHSDLELEGYEVQAVVIPAAAVNAPHGRDRVWFVAHNHNHGLYGTKDGQSVGQRNERDTEGSNQTRESSRCANKDAIFTTNTKFKSEGSDGGTNDETKRNIRRGNEGNVFGTLRSNGIIANTNGDGFEQRRGHDGIGQNVDGGNTSFKWATNSKDIDGCNTNGISEKQSTVGPRISEQTNDEKNKFTTTKGICRLDQMHNEFKGIITIDKCKIINSGTLVQKGFKRIQSPKHRGMAKDCRDISSYGTNECKNDGTIINRMDGDVADTRGIGFQREGESTQLEGGRFGFNNPQNNKTTWDNFPTQSPICGGDDGLPTELDRITFSKWRNESIKAYGNAIVPQVAYQIFKAIQQTI
jgi:site-specific DNA-cytosine methylase